MAALSSFFAGEPLPCKGRFSIEFDYQLEKKKREGGAEKKKRKGKKKGKEKEGRQGVYRSNLPSFSSFQPRAISLSA